jgi:hypothetical protein
MTHSPYDPPESIPIEKLNAAHATRMRARAALTILIFLAFVIIGAAATYYYSAKTFPNTAMRAAIFVEHGQPSAKRADYFYPLPLLNNSLSTYVPHSSRPG